MSSSRKLSLLNKISIEGPAWLASDIHLGPDNPKTAEMFFGFLEQAGAHAGALFLLGDIFDVWIGDDWVDDPPPWLAKSLKALAQAARQTKLYIGHGNRDFLMGKNLANRIGAQLLDEQCILNARGRTVLLAHGDEFCTTDRAYQRFRKLVRHPLTQAIYLKLSLKRRLAIAHHARLKSMQSQANPNAVWHDVTLESIDQALTRVQTRTVIHGHTHRPGHYIDEIVGQTIDRWVLPDWEADHLQPGQPVRGGWLVADRDGLTLFEANGKAVKK